MDGGAPLASDGDCGAPLAAFLNLTYEEANDVLWHLSSLNVADCIDSCSTLGLNETEWNATTLATDQLRRPVISKLVHAVRRVSRAIYAMNVHKKYPGNNKTEHLKYISSQWRDYAQLISCGVKHLSQLFVPLAFELMDNHTSDHQLQEWIKNAEHLRGMLDTKFSGCIHDMQYVSKHIADYKIEENKSRPGYSILRRPLLNEDLLEYQERFSSFIDDFTAQCEKQQPKAYQMFGLADALYAFFSETWFRNRVFYRISNAVSAHNKDEEWQLEDRSGDTLTADTGCLQLLADALDHPRCPLEDLPPETIQQRQQCRRQLWDDMVQRSPHIPVTSYLAYTQRASVHLCLLAWMAVNSLSICQDVPFSMIQSVHDARCYFDSPDDQLCPQSNDTDAICVVSRAIMFLKCRYFSSVKNFDACRVQLYTDGSYSAKFFSPTDITNNGNVKATDKTLHLKQSLNSATLKYRDFKVDSLEPLEISFIAMNILFRFLTAAVYVWLPHCRNLPGKILLSFQITTMMQILCSEIIYRAARFPNLPTMVLIDTAFTFLSCLWLNVFCYQMYACVRHLRLPNDLLPAEARKIFRRRVVYALLPWTMVCTACTVLETTNKHYLIYSRILFLVVISLSVVFNLACLALVGYMYLRTRNSMQELKIYSKDKFASKKQLVFMSAKTVVLSGIGIIIRIGFHQAQGIAQFVYYVHIATMVQGPVLFVLFVCNETTLPALRNRIAAWFDPDVIIPGEELCSAAERNLARRRGEQPLAAESPV